MIYIGKLPEAGRRGESGVADVIVVGLGTMGAATAYHLANRGAQVLGIDRFRPPHTRGAHAGGSRIIRMAYAEGADYVPLLRRTYELWHDVEAASGATLLTRSGGLMLGPLDGMTVGGALESARAHGLPHELLDPAGVRRRFPQFTPADDEMGLYEEVAGLVRPEAAIDTHLRLAARAGADLRYGVAVTGWRATENGVAVTTADDTRYEADRLVLCAGAWAPELLADLGVPMVVHRRVQHYWDGPAGDYLPGRFPVWMWEYAPGLVAYGLPTVDGSGAKASLHHGDEQTDPDVGAGNARPEEVQAMRELLAPRLPGLADAAWLGGKPCLYTLTPDENFVLGRHPRHDRVSVAAGFSGHGFKFAPVVGEILTDLALTGSTRHPIALFAPDRFAAPTAGLS